MTRRYLTVLCGLLAALLPASMSACTSRPVAGNGGKLEGITWMLTECSAGVAMKQIPGAVTASAEFKDGKIGGQVVNSYGGSYRARSNGALAITQLSSTLMAGPPEAMAVETAYFAALQKVASYTSDGSVLTMYDKGGAQILVFRASDVALTGDWTVTALNNGKQAVVSVTAASTITMAFDGTGELTGNAGVNLYTAAYTTAGTDRISISDIATTKTAGPEDLLTQEQAFTAALKASDTYAIKGDRLELRDSDGAIQIQATRAK